MMRNHRPPVSDFVVHFEENFFLFRCPLGLLDGSIEVVVVSGIKGKKLPLTALFAGTT
jgi:hypothetical protein